MSTRHQVFGSHGNKKVFTAVQFVDCAYQFRTKCAIFKALDVRRNRIRD